MMFICVLIESWEVDKHNEKKKGNNVQKKKSKNFLNFLLEPSRSKMDHKKAINES